MQKHVTDVRQVSLIRRVVITGSSLLIIIEKCPQDDNVSNYLTLDALLYTRDQYKNNKHKRL